MPPSDDSYDVAIIGAGMRTPNKILAALSDLVLGPSGATCGYYLAKKGRKVVVLEKALFPRDKYCGT